MFPHNSLTTNIHSTTDNLEDEDDASILLSMCTSAPHLEISIRCTIDTELEKECAVIAWKNDDDHDTVDQEEAERDGGNGSHNSDGCSGSWRTDSDGEERPDVSAVDQCTSGTDSDEAEEDSKSSQSIDHDVSSTSSGSDGQDLWDDYDQDDHPQYLFEVDRDNVLESSLNALENMSK